MPILKHTHTFVKYKSKRHKGDLWKCNDPACTFWTEKALILGKMSLCNGCGTEIILTNANMKQRTRPRCLGCSNTGEAKQYKAIRSITDDLFRDHLSIREEREGEKI